MCTLHKKVFSVAPVKYFFSLGFKLLKLSYFWECLFGRDQRSQFNNNTFPKIFSATKVLGLCLPCIKRESFSCTSEMFFSLGLKLFKLSYFWECLFGKDQRSQFNNNTFSKIFPAMEVLAMCLYLT